MHPVLLKESANEVSGFLAKIFNKSIQKGRLPMDWKTAVVVPLHKKGSQKKAENFRSVSLTSVICKVLESIIRDSLLHHMESNNLFTDQQHGFRSCRSCTTQLLEVIEDWYESIENNDCIDCIYLDFQKAFDTVPHQRLLNKMESYGIRGNIQNWTKHFLKGRSQSVRVGKNMSEKVEVKSGIPQGSVLGPILFLIFINDLPDVVQSTVKLFADDTKLYAPIVDEVSCEKLQSDLDNLADWSDK